MAIDVMALTIDKMAGGVMAMRHVSVHVVMVAVSVQMLRSRRNNHHHGDGDTDKHADAVLHLHPSQGIFLLCLAPYLIGIGLRHEVKRLELPTQAKSAGGKTGLGWRRETGRYRVPADET
jgi:hypothetical protein